MKVLVISADNFEDSELSEPVKELKVADVIVDIASLEKGTIKGKKGTKIEVTHTVDEVNPDEYDMLILPGGKAPETLRKSQRVLAIAKTFMQADKPIAAICHGPQILISAGLVQDKTMTCYQSVQQELEEAGANYVNKEVVVDGNLITSRQPSDLPAFNREIFTALQTEAA